MLFICACAEYAPNLSVFPTILSYLLIVFCNILNTNLYSLISQLVITSTGSSFEAHTRSKIDPKFLCSFCAIFNVSIHTLTIWSYTRHGTKLRITHRILFKWCCFFGSVLKKGTRYFIFGVAFHWTYCN